MVKFLATFNVSFKAPDGKDYRSAWGRIKLNALERPILHIGEGTRKLLIPLEYMVAKVRCDSKPQTEPYDVSNSDLRSEMIYPGIYIAEDEEAQNDNI